MQVNGQRCNNGIEEEEENNINSLPNSVLAIILCMLKTPNLLEVMVIIFVRSPVSHFSNKDCLQEVVVCDSTRTRCVGTQVSRNETTRKIPTDALFTGEPVLFCAKTGYKRCLGSLIHCFIILDFQIESFAAESISRALRCNTSLKNLVVRSVLLCSKHFSHRRYQIRP